MKKAKQIGINVPEIYYEDKKNFKITMEYINSSLKLKDYLNILIENNQQVKIEQILK